MPAKNVILIVDDGLVEQHIHGDAAKKAMPKGYRVEIAGNYDTAQKFLAGGNVALLITDNEFPSNFGDPKTLEAIRKQSNMSDAEFKDLEKLGAMYKANSGIELVRRTRTVNTEMPIIWNSANMDADKIEKLRIATGLKPLDTPYTDDTNSIRFDANTVATRKGPATIEAIIAAAEKLPPVEHERDIFSTNRAVKDSGRTR